MSDCKDAGGINDPVTRQKILDELKRVFAEAPQQSALDRFFRGTRPIYVVQEIDFCLDEEELDPLTITIKADTPEKAMDSIVQTVKYVDRKSHEHPTGLTIDSIFDLLRFNLYLSGKRLEKTIHAMDLDVRVDKK